MKPNPVDDVVYTLNSLLEERGLPPERFLGNYRERLRKAADPVTGLVSQEGAYFSIVPTPWRIGDLVGTRWRNVETATEFVVQQVIDNGSGQPELLRHFAPDYMSGPAWLGFWYRLERQSIYLVRHWVRVDDLDPALQEGWTRACERRNQLAVPGPQLPLRPAPDKPRAKPALQPGPEQLTFDL